MSVPPRAVFEVAAEPGDSGLDVTDLGEGRDRAAHAGIEIRMRASPVRAEEAVDAVVGDKQRAALDVSQRAPELVDRRKDRAVDHTDLGEVVVDQPEA